MPSCFGRMIGFIARAQMGTHPHFEARVDLGHQVEQPKAPAGNLERRSTDRYRVELRDLLVFEQNNGHRDLAISSDLVSFPAALRNVRLRPDGARSRVLSTRNLGRARPNHVRSSLQLYRRNQHPPGRSLGRKCRQCGTGPVHGEST